MGKPVDYVPACLPEKKKAPTLQFGLFFWISTITAYMFTIMPE
jgi:hypothetical protein